MTSTTIRGMADAFPPFGGDACPVPKDEERVRVFNLAVSLLMALVPIAIPRPAGAQIDSIVVRAGRVAYYQSKQVVTADGDVRVTMTDGTIVTGRTFAMDLKLNRFMIAGGVRITHGDLRYEGAALSEFLDFRRGYFLPATPEPDRWTFLDEDYAKPAKGRVMPGDAFTFPNTGVDHPLVLAKMARIVPKTGVTLKPARIYVEGVYTPTPEYYANISTNPYFAENSLAGATGAVGWPFLGSEHATTTLFGRYDSVNKTYLAIEQNFAWKNAWIATSINPLTRPEKQYNFLGLIKTNNQRFQVSTFDQVSNFQHGFSEPYESSAFENAQLTYGLHNSFLQLTANQYNWSLLARPQPDSNGNYWVYSPSYPWGGNHPNNFSLSWVGSPQRVSLYTPINFKFRGGIMYARDAVNGIGYFAGTPYNAIWQHYVGFTVWSNPIRLTPHAPFDRSVNLSMTYDRQRNFYDLPHYSDAGQLSTVLSKLNGTKGSMYLAYTITQEGDFAGPYQQDLYPGYNMVVNGVTYPTWQNFHGLSTLRDLQYAYTYTPSAYFSATLVAEKHNDFPQGIPFFYGNPPYDVTGRLQIRISPILSVVIQRQYDFGFGPERWGAWGIQFGP
jgi:hypothetical protein